MFCIVHQALSHIALQVIWVVSHCLPIHPMQALNMITILITFEKAPEKAVQPESHPIHAAALWQLVY